MTTPDMERFNEWWLTKNWTTDAMMSLVFREIALQAWEQAPRQKRGREREQLT